MILISHRGNINKKLPYYENEPSYIDDAINKGYDVEIDVWCINNKIYLGHDEPQYEIDLTWIENRSRYLWIHCKNIDSVIFFKKTNLNFFWHQKDDITLTSKGFIWAYPGKQPIVGSIAVMPEINNDNISQCLGICSDNIEKYKTEIK